MGLLTILKKVKEEEKEIRVLVLGLDNAGKTTIVKRLCGQPIDEVEPTLGFAIHTLDYNLSSTSGASRSLPPPSSEHQQHVNHEDNSINGSKQKGSDGGGCGSISNNGCIGALDFEDDDDNRYKLHLWDIGGQSTIRAYWRNYFEKTDAIVWVVDSSDRSRLNVATDELSTVLRQERLAGATLLIFANKCDVPNAMDPAEVSRAMRLESDLLKGQTHTRHWKIQGCSAVTTDGLGNGIEWLVRDVTDRIFYTG